MQLSRLDIETKRYKKIKDRRDKIHKTHSRTQLSLDHRRNEDILYELKADSLGN
jgi:hypothetical protein